MEYDEQRLRHWACLGLYLSDVCLAAQVRLRPGTQDETAAKSELRAYLRGLGQLGFRTPKGAPMP